MGVTCARVISPMSLYVAMYVFMDIGWQQYAL